MGTAVSRTTVLAFFEAFAVRDAARVAPLLADDVEWTMAGPVGVFRFCGHRRGKAAVLDYITRLVPEMLTVIRSEPQELVIEGDSAGAFSKITALQRDTGRTITYHCAHFARFAGGKLVSMHGVTDTFGIAEQVFGRRIDAFRMSDLQACDDGLVML